MGWAPSTSHPPSQGSCRHLRAGRCPLSGTPLVAYCCSCSYRGVAGPSHGTLSHQGRSRGVPRDPRGQMMTQDGSKVGRKESPLASKDCREQARRIRTKKDHPSPGPSLCLEQHMHYLLPCLPPRWDDGIIRPFYRRGNRGCGQLMGPAQ